MISVFPIINGSITSLQDWIFCTRFRILVHVYFLPKWFSVMIHKHLLANPTPASANMMLITKASTKSKEFYCSSIISVCYLWKYQQFETRPIMQYSYCFFKQRFCSIIIQNYSNKDNKFMYLHPYIVFNFFIFI